MVEYYSAYLNMSSTQNAQLFLMGTSIHINFTKVYTLKPYVGQHVLINQNIGHQDLTLNVFVWYTSCICRPPDSLASSADHCSKIINAVKIMFGI